MSSPLLQLRGVDKQFPGVHALRSIDFDLAVGEAVGIIGENGAGKSTLIKLLSAVHRPTSGEIRWSGRPVSWFSPREAMKAGVATIHQELAYFAHLSVAENLMMGERWPRRAWGGVHWRALHREAKARLDAMEIDLPTDRAFDRLSAAEKQEVAMARALWQKSRLLILDEPTASLTEVEVERLFRHLERLSERGVSILYISHRLDEVLRLCDRIVVLRDGEMVGEHEADAVDAPTLVREMVGRSIDTLYFPPKDADGKRSIDEKSEPVLQVKNLTQEPFFRDVSLSVMSGEIVGLAGLVGSGRSDLARSIYGLSSADGGTMSLRGRSWNPAGPKDSLRVGLVYLPEERKKQALVLDHSLADTISLGFSDLISRFGQIPRTDEAERVQAAIDQFEIRSRSPDQLVGTLSGGNQQKAVLSRWLSRDPSVLILDEPTRGIDVGAKVEIHRWMRDLVEAGKSILLISSDLPEIIGMSDRILVMAAGSIVAELRGDAMTQENILLTASGIDMPTSGEEVG